MADKVVILHGILRTHRNVRGLARFLERSGYDVLNQDYPSTKHDLETLADIIHPRVASFIGEGRHKTHFIGFSMGGLLIRAYLKKYRPMNLGRAVLVGVPNRGSEVADLLKNFVFYKKLFGPAGQQLITNQQSFKHIFCDVDFEIGVIAGSKSIYPISSKIIGKPNDGRVSIESAFMDEATDQIVIPTSHTFFPHNGKMWTQTLSFLKDGRFAR